MKIEVLYVPGCPNYQPAVERVQRALAREAVQDQIQSVAVNTEAEANALSFPGSPTVRINGVDVEPPQRSVPGLACRLYANRSGIPSEEAVRLAISRAKEKRSDGRMSVARRATPVGALIAALASLGCCLPLGFVGAAGLAGLLIWLQPFRPFLLGGALLLLGLGFVDLYVRGKQCRRRSRLSVALFWVAAATVVFVIVFPQLFASLIAG